MKRVYCSKCKKETHQDIAEDPRRKSEKCKVHPENDQDLKGKIINKQLAKDSASKVSANRTGENNLGGYV